MLLRCPSRHWLEPVGIVRGTMLDRPVLHCIGYDLGDIERELLFTGLHPLEFLVDALGQTLPHGPVTKAVLSVGATQWLLDIIDVPLLH